MKKLCNAWGRRPPLPHPSSTSAGLPRALRLEGEGEEESSNNVHCYLPWPHTYPQQATHLPALGDPDINLEGTSASDIPVKAGWKLFSTYFPLSKTARFWLTKDIWKRSFVFPGHGFLFLFLSSFLLVEKKKRMPRQFLQHQLLFLILAFSAVYFHFFSQFGTMFLKE